MDSGRDSKNSPDDRASLVQDWQRVRSAIEHENDLINQRLTWLLVSQGFIFGAFGVALNKLTEAVHDLALRNDIHALLFALASTGFLTSIFFSRGILTAHLQHNALKLWWEKRVPDKLARERDHPPICGNHPSFGFQIPYHWFPYVFTCAWLCLSIIGWINYWQLDAASGVILTIGAVVIIIFIPYLIYNFAAAFRAADEKEAAPTVSVATAPPPVAETVGGPQKDG